jgi:hypothetical protein
LAGVVPNWHQIPHDLRGVDDSTRAKLAHLPPFVAVVLERGYQL